MENSTDGIVQSTNTSNIKSMVATPPNFLLVVTFWLIFCFGVSGNSVLLCVNITQRSVKQAATQLFIISLALSDLGLLFGTTWIKAYLSLDPNFIFGNFVCKFTSIWMSVAGDASVATLTVIGVDRYLSISRPGNIYFTFRQAIAVMSIIWVIVIATDIPMALWFNVFATGPSSLACAPTFDVHAVAQYTLIGRIIQFFIPLGIIVVSYGGIWLKLTLSRRQVVADIRSKPADNSSYRKVAKMCTVVVVVFLATWIPFEIDLLYYAYGSNQQFAIELMAPLGVLVNANSCVNPVIYGFMWKPMKLWLQNPCRRYRNKHRESSNETSTKSTKSAISHPTAGLQQVAVIEHGE